MVLFSLNTQRFLQSRDTKNTASKDITSVLLCSVVLAATILSLYGGFNRYILRYEQASDIPKVYFQNRQLTSNIGKNGKWLYGKVLSVGDGDNLNFYHMPGGFWAGWGTIRHEPKLKLNTVKAARNSPLVVSRDDFNPLSLAWGFLLGNTNAETGRKRKSSSAKSEKSNSKKKQEANSKSNIKTQASKRKKSSSSLKKVNWFNRAYQTWFADKTSSHHFMSLPVYYSNNYKHKTISIRLCGIDAPERSHFGSKAQPFSDEAMNFLKHTLLNKKIYVKPLEIDRYGRCVARVVYYDGFLFRKEKDISLEMLKVGLATIYESKSTVDFDGQEEAYKQAELESKKKKRGMWRLKKLETPAEFKRKLRS